MLQHFQMWSGLLSMLGILTTALSANADISSTLVVEVNGLRNRQGQVCLSIFLNSRGFPSNSANALQSKCVKITDVPLQVKFEQLSPGSYAIGVLHDENTDNQPNLNFLGIPTEGFGFSRNPAIVAGPPKFADSVFIVAGPTMTVQIQVNYL
ncbi:DUF2141 domain-containing protein [Nostoc sp. UHCC 0302]|uniref:DUF2141 domain-containing protein n=1 Tax=Nostoc sp. UHCC 0302 TaxID=3134896 RepID=UPI00311CA333